MYDVVIAGGGPAGMTAAIYAVRSGLSALLLTGPEQGGQLAFTNVVENYPGFPMIYGAELVEKLREHTESAGVESVSESVVGLQLAGPVKTVRTEEHSYEARTVVLAQGSERRKLGIPGEAEFTGRGVSYCATCDGSFFRGKTVAVIGGGSTAVGDAVELAALCRKVYLVSRSGKLRAMDYLVRRAKELPNIEFLPGFTPAGIRGAQKVERLALRAMEGGEEKVLDADGVFVSIGVEPNTKLLRGVLPLSDGFVEAPESGETAIPGVFVAGDLRKKELYQIVTAVADGANAAHSALRYLQKQSAGA